MCRHFKRARICLEKPGKFLKYEKVLEIWTLIFEIQFWKTWKMSIAP